MYLDVQTLLLRAAQPLQAVLEPGVAWAPLDPADSRPAGGAPALSALRPRIQKLFQCRSWPSCASRWDWAAAC